MNTSFKRKFVKKGIMDTLTNSSSKVVPFYFAIDLTN